MNDWDVCRLSLILSRRRRNADDQVIATLKSKSTFTRWTEADDVFEDYAVEKGGIERLCCGWQGAECRRAKVRWAEFGVEDECASFDVFCGFGAWIFAPIEGDEVA